LAAVKHPRTFGVARSESRSAHTKSLRPVIFFDSSSGMAATGAEIATTHSTSPSKLDASTALPPIDEPTSATSLTPRSRSTAVAGRSSQSSSRHRVEQRFSVDERSNVLRGPDGHSRPGALRGGSDMRKEHGIFELEQGRLDCRFALVDIQAGTGDDALLQRLRE